MPYWRYEAMLLLAVCLILGGGTVAGLFGMAFLSRLFERKGLSLTLTLLGIVAIITGFVLLLQT